MNAGFRRLLALGAVFAIAFLAVSALRIWRSGGDFRALVPWLGGSGENFHPETFTLPEKAPLKLDDVELLGRLNDEYARLTQAVVPSVVSIDTASVKTERLLDMWGRLRVNRYPTRGQGSGVIVSSEGHIVTNHHVIAGQQKIQVTLHGGKTYPATLVGEDDLLDIAVIKIQGEGPFTPLKLGDSSEVKVGQMVFAIGNPFGLGETVTQGIISAKERSISDSQPDLFQTDAAINPGNSGGPLVNLRGEIIGINVAIYSQDQDRESRSFLGIGFSIPANDVKEALLQILERGRRVRGFLGVGLRDLDPAASAATGYTGGEGAMILNVVTDSPAQAAGIQANDVILRFGSQPVRNTTQLKTLIQRTRIGDKIPVRLWRAGATVDVEVTIAEAPVKPPAQSPGPDVVPESPEKHLEMINVHVRDLTAQEAIRGYQGIVVTRVPAESTAARFVQPGDLIIGVNNVRVAQARELLEQLSSPASGQNTVLHVRRGGNTLRIELPEPR
ncbi:trypsin-like peptidase domain-containing protein [Luteolibacter sp. SL250]|uniref:trypsin-like peptidase domain-containing protein n=1 Tax=Luteolibacter sp. SL250 TaxID=2995170 RepID=UPI00226E66A9|nr:trypsin-like peptidase domain-containing protein [Luteolibacter sp. SL250]WAC19982.1 trypsin-like peptidase domain-containing protein [Luteolibacter sp. SL250]